MHSAAGILHFPLPAFLFEMGRSDFLRALSRLLPFSKVHKKLSPRYSAFLSPPPFSIVAGRMLLITGVIREKKGVEGLISEILLRRVKII